MTAVAVPITSAVDDTKWADVRARAPMLAATMTRYLNQIAVSLRPNSVIANERVLRHFAEVTLADDGELFTAAGVGRLHVERYKSHLRERRNRYGRPLSPNTIRFRLGMLRTFFDRIIEWEYDDAPRRVPIYDGDLPKPDEPLPKFLDDATATKLLRAAANEPDALRRLVIELLAGTGVRVGELCALEPDAMVLMASGHWLRVPLGKLHNDRYVPLHPRLAQLITDWQIDRTDDGTGRLLSRDGRPLNRHVVTRMLNRVAKRAGIGHVHPHQLRHTLATQAVNRGMRLEAIAEILGHRTLRMTIRYARIANRTVADEYHAVAEQVEALYANPQPLPKDETPAMRQLRQEHRRMLANGYCVRPAQLDCSFESICEHCTYFATAVEFKPTLRRQRDHAVAHDQPGRAQLYQQLLERTEEQT
jgi:integrase